MPPTVTIEAELTHEQAHALALFLKRVSLGTCEDLADPTRSNEPVMMLEGLDVIKKSLAEKGWAPR